MSDLSFTSSSESSLALVPGDRLEALAAGIRRLPLGFLGAGVLVAVLHLTTTALCPEPLANDFARRLALAGTRTGSPAIILGGDSRVQLGVDPARLNQRLTLPQGRVINLAMPCGDSTVFTATYRKFAPHFAPRPIVLLGVSLFTVNDGAAAMFSQSFLETLSLRERLQIVRPAEAVAGVFLPEKSLWQLSIAPVSNLFPSHVTLFNPPIPAYRNVRAWTPLEQDTKLQAVKDSWLARPNLDGLRWRKFASDIADLHREGAQLVLVDSPYHPRLEHEMAEAPLDQVYTEFHGKLNRLCANFDIPLLRYGAADLGAVDCDAVFMDFTHLDQVGADLFTDRVAEDVARLIAAGKVRLPDALMPACHRRDVLASLRKE